MRNVDAHTWELVINGRKSGTLTVRSIDQPWVICSFRPEPYFDAYAEDFYHEAELLESEGGSQWEALFDKISEWDICLKGENGLELNEILLHINRANEAWFRY